MALTIDNKQVGKPQENDEIRQIYKVAGYAFLLNLFLAIMKVLLAVF